MQRRTAILFEEHLQRILRRTDRILAGLLAAEWLGGIAVALWVSPRAWAGRFSQTHIHVWAALCIGTAIASLPLALVLRRPGTVWTRQVIGAGQMLFSVLLIHLTGGRIETHFFVFGSLAFLAFYRDWRVLVTGSLVVVVDHFLRGYLWPQSVYGVLTASPWRAVEHGWWVLFEDVFLIASCRQGIREMLGIAERQARLEAANESIEKQVSERTSDLKASEERFRMLSEASPVGIYQTDTAGRCLYTNARWQGIFCMSLEESLGEGWSRAIHPEDRAWVMEEWKACVREGRDFDGELRVLTPRGEVRWVHGRSAVVRSAEGEATEFVGTVEDVTERKRAEEELQKAKEAADAAAAAKSEFLANMSHEIRTPMNGVIGMTGLLLGTRLDREQRECAETVRQSGEALLTIINDILDFSKIEAGRLELERIDFDLHTVIEETVALLAERAHAKQLELASLVHHDVPGALRGDPGRLRQILINLVGNAIKFTEAGEVVLRARLAEERDGTVSVRFEVSDTGPGLSAEKLGRLFHPFTQADGSTSRMYGGTGLGLAICKQLAELMGGRIGVDSRAGEGSTFWFTARFEKGTPDPATPPAPLDSLRGLRVLIVDDSRTNRHILTAHIRSWGMTAEEAEDGPRALELLRASCSEKRPYDLVILDMQMPGMDGLQLARAIKAQPKLARLPLVMLTSVGMRGHAGESRRAGIAGYLTKPVRQSQFYDCLATVLSAAGDRVRGAPAPSAPLVTRHSLKEVKARSRRRVLVADDNGTNQMVAVRMLSKLGYRADVATSGTEAVEALSRIPYDLVLMDCQMPEMDGFEATRAIRRAEAGRGRRTPIVAMTANALPGAREQCLGAGMDDYLPKPVKIEDLDRALRRWIKGASPEPRGSRGASSGKRARGARPGAAAARGAGGAEPSAPDAVKPAASAQRDDRPAMSTPRAHGADQVEGDGPLDAATLASLREADADGSSGFLRMLIDKFLGKEAPGQLASLRAAVARADPQALVEAAHSLKGSSGALGARVLSALCGEVEGRGRAGSVDSAADLLARLEDEFERVRAALEAERAGRGQDGGPSAPGRQAAQEEEAPVGRR